MRVLSIGVNKCADEVFKYIENELIQLKNDKIDYSIDKIKDEGYESIICKVPNQISGKGNKAGIQDTNTQCIQCSGRLYNMLL